MQRLDQPGARWTRSTSAKSATTARATTATDAGPTARSRRRCSTASRARRRRLRSSSHRVVATRSSRSRRSTRRPRPCAIRAASIPATSRRRVYLSFDVPAGACASISAMGDDGFTPFLCRVTARGAPFSCRIGVPPASGDVIDDIVRPPHGGDLGRAPPAIAGACACEPRSAPTAGCTARSSTRGPKFDPAPAGASRR